MFATVFGSLRGMRGFWFRRRFRRYEECNLRKVVRGAAIRMTAVSPREEKPPGTILRKKKNGPLHWLPLTMPGTKKLLRGYNCIPDAAYYESARREWKEKTGNGSRE